tara:strand:+ start:433 stop:639 length:207 start_codon:yes stop_codon:yes gene_type:complete
MGRSCDMNEWDYYNYQSKDIIELKLRVLGYRKKIETLERQIHHIVEIITKSISDELIQEIYDVLAEEE